MKPPDPLDNPIWAALATAHSSLATASGAASRYAPTISTLAGLREPTERAFDDLSNLVAPDKTVGLFTASTVQVPSSWTIDRERWIDQMVYEGVGCESEGSSLLREADVPAMLQLTAATEPGPFYTRTIEMGRYLGIRASDGTLVAMAGERLRADSFTEISAVCTSPKYRGKGYEGLLVATLCKWIVDEGRTPILHVKTENGAKALYEKLGFRFGRAIRLTVIRRAPYP